MEIEKASSPFADAPKPKPEPKPGRFLARFVGSRRRCGNCKHFNVAVLRDELAQHPHFMAAAQVLSPDKMGLVKPAEGEEAPPPPPQTGAKWSELGACLKHSEGRWSGDCCKDWG